MIFSFSFNEKCQCDPVVWGYLETLEECALTALACDGSVISYIFPKSEFLGQGCLWTFSVSCLQALRLINDCLHCQIVLFYCQFCSAIRKSAVHVSFTLIHIGLEMLSLLSYFPRNVLICCLCALLCSLTDWKCLLFAKKWNLFDTWSLNRIHFILCFDFQIIFRFLGKLVFHLVMSVFLLCHFFSVEAFLRK